MALFNNIRETARNILINLEQYHHNLTGGIEKIQNIYFLYIEIIETEQAVGDLMLHQALAEKKHLAEVMNVFASAEHQCAKYRQVFVNS